MAGERGEAEIEPGEEYIRREDLKQFEKRTRQNWKATLVLVSMVARLKSKAPESENMDEETQHPVAAATKVLLIGIDPAFSRDIIAALETSGFEVITSQNADEGFLRVKEASMVILDEELPDVTAACKRICECSHVPLVLLGSRIDPDAWDNAVALGADAYFKREMSRREMIARIRAILRRYRTIRHSVRGEGHE